MINSNENFLCPCKTQIMPVYEESQLCSKKVGLKRNPKVFVFSGYACPCCDSDVTRDLPESGRLIRR